MSDAIAITRLRKSFGSVHAVRGLDLTISPGEIVAFLGPNGAGKSTTNEMILGITKPDEGTVTVFGDDPVTAVHQGKVGAMLQGGALLAEATVTDLLILMHGLHAHPLPLTEVIERADVGSFLRTKTDKLSGGQAQRVRFAMAILPDPELLILDEPTVGMDVEIRMEFWRSMRDFTSGGRTVLFATHYLDEADEMADRVVVIADGQTVADGTSSEIKSRVAGRVISFAGGSISIDSAAVLPAAVRVERAGPRLLVHTVDSDATLRALLGRHADIHDIEISSAKLEDAFLALTTDRQANLTPERVTQS